MNIFPIFKVSSAEGVTEKIVPYYICNFSALFDSIGEIRTKENEDAYKIHFDKNGPLINKNLIYEFINKGVETYMDPFNQEKYDELESFNLLIDMPSLEDSEFVAPYNKIDEAHNKMKEDKIKSGYNANVLQPSNSDGGEYSNIGDGKHYEENFIGYVREQELKYGTIAAFLICISMVDKYEMRLNKKKGVPIEKDLTKRDWYQAAANHFRKKIESLGKPNDMTANPYVNITPEVISLIKKEMHFSEKHFLSNKAFTMAELVKNELEK